MKKQIEWIDLDDLSLEDDGIEEIAEIEEDIPEPEDGNSDTDSDLEEEFPEEEAFSEEEEFPEEEDYPEDGEYLEEAYPEDGEYPEEEYPEDGEYPEEEYPEDGEYPEEEYPEKDKTSFSWKQLTDKLPFRINLHLVLLLFIVLIVAIIALKLYLWNQGTKPEEISAEQAASSDTECMDNIVPTNSASLEKVEDDGELNIVFFGNGQLAEEKDSENNLANLIAARTGANVYNFAVEDSYMSLKNDHYKNSFIYDAFSFYNLCTVSSFKDKRIFEWAERDMKDLGQSIPEDVSYLTSTLPEIDFSKIDVICISYDSSDYQDERPPYTDDNSSDANAYVGALEAGVDLLKQQYPNIRIIVMSPTYSYYLDKDGKTYDSFEEDHGLCAFYIYVIHEQDTCFLNNITYVDNFYGTIHKGNADQYLIDYKRANTEGLNLLADRFVYALNRFNDYDFEKYLTAKGLPVPDSLSSEKEE